MLPPAGKAIITGWVAVDEWATGPEVSGDGVDGAVHPR